VSSTAILIHEREPHWTPELQRQFADEAVVVRHCSPLDWDKRRKSYDAVVLIVDLASSDTAGLAWLMRLRMVVDPMIVLASPELADWEWTLRSLGISSFRTDSLSGSELARQCRRWLLPRKSGKEPSVRNE
jgi:hypothetical protein